jgi:hypothetical protein
MKATECVNQTKVKTNVMIIKRGERKNQKIEKTEKKITEKTKP